jgi:hypothetical protein
LFLGLFSVMYFCVACVRSSQYCMCLWSLYSGLPLRFPLTFIWYIFFSGSLLQEVYSKQLYVIKFVCDLWQVGGFLRVIRFHLQIKLVTKI